MCLVAHHVGRPKTCSLFTLFTKKKGQWCMTRSAIRLLQGNALSEFPLSFSSVRLLVLWVVGVTDGFQALHSAQVKVCYRSPCQVRVCHIGSVELNAIEVSVAKIGSTEIGLIEPGVVEVSSAEIGLTEIGLGEVGHAEVSIAQISAMEVGVAKACSMKVSLAKVGLREVSVAEISPAEIGLIEIGVDEVSSAEIRTYLRVLLSPCVPCSYSLSEQKQVSAISHVAFLLSDVLIIDLLWLLSKQYGWRISLWSVGLSAIALSEQEVNIMNYYDVALWRWWPSLWPDATDVVAAFSPRSTAYDLI